MELELRSAGMENICAAALDTAPEPAGCPAPTKGKLQKSTIPVQSPTAISTPAPLSSVLKAPAPGLPEPLAVASPLELPSCGRLETCPPGQNGGPLLSEMAGVAPGVISELQDYSQTARARPEPGEISPMEVRGRQ